MRNNDLLRLPGLYQFLDIQEFKRPPDDELLFIMPTRDPGMVWRSELDKTLNLGRKAAKRAAKQAAKNHQG